jgi:hypothetical protein
MRDARLEHEDDPNDHADAHVLAGRVARHPRTGRFLAHDCEVDCLAYCAGLCGAPADEEPPEWLRHYTAARARDRGDDG